jgi:hypothetical protein
MSSPSTTGGRPGVCGETSSLGCPAVVIARDAWLHQDRTAGDGVGVELVRLQQLAEAHILVFDFFTGGLQLSLVHLCADVHPFRAQVCSDLTD